MTEEKLISTLFENDEKVGIFSSEGDLFERFKSSVRMDFHKIENVYLKAYSGDALRVDRITRSTEILYSPALTICTTDRHRRNAEKNYRSYTQRKHN